MLVKTQQISAPSTLTVYVEPGAETLVSQLEHILLEHQFKLNFVATPLEEQSRPLFVACQNNLSACALVTKYELNNSLIYWLPLHNDPQDSPLPKIGYWLAMWRESHQLQPILALVNHYSSLSSKFEYAYNKLALLTDCVGELTMTLSENGQVVDLDSGICQLLGQPKTMLLGQNWQNTLHIPSPSAQARMEAILNAANGIKSITRLSTFPIKTDDQIIIMDGFVGSSNDQSLVLILRQVANWPIQEWKEQQTTGPVSLLLINPDNLAEINQSYDRSQGDLALKEIQQFLAKTLRDNDFATRYSGAVFAAQLPDTNSEQAQQLANRLQYLLANKQYAQHKSVLTFSMGIASIEGHEPQDEQSPLELFRRANSALQAARNIGGGKLVVWRPQFDTSVLANLDRMSGKFSNQPNDDFRLMMLQWDVIRLLAKNHSLQSFAAQSCQLLETGLNCESLAMFLLNEAQLSEIGRGTNKLAQEKSDSIQYWAREILQQQLKAKQEFSAESANIEQQICAFIPLVTREQCQGVLVASWPLNDKSMAAKCSNQLQQIAPNLAAALDRIRLLEQQQKPILNGQGNSPHQHQLVFESPAMRTLMQQVQLVGPTDATVLVIGESGTGKELIAQQIHNNSLRADKPFVTVDCSTIVEHLIESELFGHRRGAFTGANSDKPGRIAQADGGSLFLDEIGELPLDIQSKLLRFVQEKTYVAVGDQRVRKVDVRLILATNRNLAEEVSKGRFRGDLYYRINVFTVNLPPLNQRGKDKLLLARHYVAIYAEQYAKSIDGLSVNAERKIMAYAWPGNVRELQNSLMRSVIVCQGDKIEPEHLILQQQNTDQVSSELPTIELKPKVHQQPSTDPDLTKVLKDLVDFALNQAQPESIAELYEKHILEQCLVQWDSLYKVSQQLKVSESTLRRRYQKACDTEFKLVLPQTLSQKLNDQLQLTLQTQTSQGLWTVLENLLYKTVLDLASSQQLKARLLNVSQPTLRKLTAQIQSA